MNEREYMMTEGWLWTGQYPECRRILAKGNNQSMELDENTIDAHWSENDNGKGSFFIINEAIISKLCTLGEDNEPCFEGASIGAPIIQFAFADGFKEQVMSMMNELKELLNKGGEKVFTKYSVEIGDSLWTALYNHVNENYNIISVCEEEEQKFAVLSADDKFYRLNFSILEEGNFEFAAEAELLEDFTPEEEPQFDPAKVAEYVEAQKEPETEEEEVELCPVCGKPVAECDCPGESEPEVEPEEEEEPEVEDKPEKYNLDEIQEYVELNEKYSTLETNYNEALQRIEALESANAELTTFKKGIEKQEKQKMIDSFYMLSDDDKKEVIENIDNYSLDDIEAKLSIICVRNKVSFNLDNDTNVNQPITYNLDPNADDGAPAWVKALRSVASNM